MSPISSPNSRAKPISSEGKTNGARRRRFAAFNIIGLEQSGDSQTRADVIGAET
jgi:hypothetical protein